MRALFSSILLLSLPATPLFADDPVIDSAMSRTEAFRYLNSDCPDELRARQRVVTVQYYSFDDKIHQGQMIVDQDLIEDIKEVFATALAQRFPIQSAIPLADKRFVVDGQWSDDRSMELNNTSAFNYRQVTGGSKLSKHSYGVAVDINPLQNPYIKEDAVLPAGAKYDIDSPGTLYEDHPVVLKFLELGWRWGGHWHSLKDYQHFEKELKN